MHARILACLFTATGVLIVACGGEPIEQACNDCHCESSRQCPGRPGCFEGICYAAGELPRTAPCASDSDCIDGLCEHDQHFCTSPCNPANVASCVSGWACYQTGACLELHSLPHGALCNHSSLCPEVDTCLNSVCETVCSIGYGVAECGPGSYCSVNPTPVCLQAKCDPASANSCASPNICVDLGAGVGVCRQPCSYTFTSAYADDCNGGIGYYGATCAPLGAGEASVCIEAAAPASPTGAAGDTCDGGARLCKRGHVCRAGVCRQLCWSQTSCASGTCTEITPDFRVCQ